jgi:hypothetical protein
MERGNKWNDTSRPNSKLAKGLGEGQGAHSLRHESRKAGAAFIGAHNLYALPQGPISVKATRGRCMSPLSPALEQLSFWLTWGLALMAKDFFLGCRSTTFK